MPTSKIITTTVDLSTELAPAIGHYILGVDSDGKFKKKNPDNSIFDFEAAAATTLISLTDVAIGSPLVNGQVLTYDSGSGKWINMTGGGGGISGIGTANYLVRWTGTSSVGIGLTQDDGTQFVIIGTDFIWDDTLGLQLQNGKSLAIGFSVPEDRKGIYVNKSFNVNTPSSGIFQDNVYTAVGNSIFNGIFNGVTDTRASGSPPGGPFALYNSLVVNSGAAFGFVTAGIFSDVNITLSGGGSMNLLTHIWLSSPSFGSVIKPTQTYGIRIDDQSFTGITNTYGLYIGSQNSGSTNAYGLISLASRNGIGTATPAISAILDLTSTTQALLIPRVTNTAAVTTPVNGMEIYDSSLNKFRAYQNSAWVDMIGSTATQTFANVAARNAAIPSFIGQLGVQTDIKVVFQSFGVSAGNWSDIITIGRVIYANSITGKTLAQGATGSVSNPFSTLTQASAAAVALGLTSTSRGCVDANGTFHEQLILQNFLDWNLNSSIVDLQAGALYTVDDNNVACDSIIYGSGKIFRSTAGTGGPLLTQNAGTILRVFCASIEGTRTSYPGVYCLNGYQEINSQIKTSNGTDGGALCAGGTQIVRNSRISTVAANYGVKQTGGVQIIENCTIICSSGVSIANGSTVKLYGGNQANIAIGTSVTLQVGTLIVDPNVV